MRSPASNHNEPIAETIKVLRLQRGWSVRQAAGLAGISHSQWARIEKGERSADNRFILAAIAQALKVPLSDLTGTTGSITDDRVQVKSAVHMTMQAVIEADLEDEPTVPIGPIAPLLQQLDLLTSLRFKCDYVGAGRLLPDLLRGLHAASFGDDRTQALRALVLADEAASFVVRYLGDPASAVLIADRSRQAAIALGDPVMLGMSSWTRAHAAAGLGLYPRTLRIAETAVADMERHTGLPHAQEMLGQLHMVTAFARYAQGDTSGAADAVTEAHRLAAITGQSSALNLNFGPTNIAFWQISMDADGVDPGRAVELARTVTPQDVPVVSRQAAFYIDTARALATIGKDLEAIRMLTVAERLAPQRVHGSPIVAETLRGLLERMRRNVGGAELRGLCERVGIQL
jgi:transcriptional regulator with XRE-family HTH domain